MNSVAIQHAVEFLDKWLAYRARQVDIPGFSVAVYCNDRVVFSGAYGLADVAMGIPMTTSHLFGMGSQSKMVTATAVLQLTAQDKLRLDDRVVHHLPWLARHTDPRFQDLTIRHLLSHSAGLIRDDHYSDYWQGEGNFPDIQALRRAVLKSSLALETNMQMKYSNLGFALLGQVIEAVSGQTYAAYVSRHIAHRLGLKDLYADWSPVLQRAAALGYTVPHNRQRTATSHYALMQALAAAAGCFATPSDMCRFAAAHFRGNTVLLNEILKSEAHKSQWVITKGYDQGYEYGLGFEIMEISDRRLIGHGGSLHGYRSATFFDTEGKLAVSVSANCKDAPVLTMLQGIFGALFHFADTASTPTPEHLSKFNVQVQNPIAAMQIVATDGAIVAIDPNDWNPFSWGEQLTHHHDNTLHVTTTNSIHGRGEEVVYTFDNDQAPLHITYGGLRLDAVKDQPNSTPEPYSLPRESSDVLFLNQLQQSDNQFFRLELLPDYDAGIEDSSESLRAWLRGKTRKSISLLEHTREQDAAKQPWLRIWPADLKLKNRAIRIRIIDDEFTPFMEWEREHFKRINIPLCGETIYYVHRKELKDLVLPGGDFMICNNQIIVNHYDGNQLTRRTFYEPSHPDATRFMSLKKQLLLLTKQQRLKPLD